MFSPLMRKLFSSLSEKPTKSPIESSRRGELDVFVWDCFFFLMIASLQWKYSDIHCQGHPENILGKELPCSLHFPSAIPCSILHGKSCWCRTWQELKAEKSQCTLHTFAASSILSQPHFLLFQKTICSIHEAASFQLWQQSPGSQNSQRNAGGKVPTEQLWEPKVSYALKTWPHFKCLTQNVED